MQDLRPRNSDWKTRNPARDRRLWGEPRRRRGRTLIWLIGAPLLVVVLGVANVAADQSHFHVDLSFGPAFGTIATPGPQTDPVVYPPNSAPGAQPAPAAKPAADPTPSKSRHTH